MQKLFKNLRADSAPALFVPQNDKGKTTHYNFNVQQKEEDEQTYFEHDTLVVAWPLTRRNVFKSLIEALYPVDYELKLINDYNAATLIIANPDQEKIDAYHNFLSEREIYRQQVINDCATANIPE